MQYIERFLRRTLANLAFVFQALADGWVRGVGCYDEGLDDDDDDDKSPGFGVDLAAIITAGVRRPRAAALAAIAHLSNECSQLFSTLPSASWSPHLML
jgi:ATP phosphoribosyltransferase regulatory subunit HisZ